MKNELFERTPVFWAVLTLGLPTMAGMLLTVLYNMADMIFIGMVGSADHLAVMTLLSPVSMISMSMGSVFGIGGASCISRQLGTKRYHDAAQTCSFCIYSTLLLGLLCTVAGQLFLPVLLRGLGATGNLNPLAESYGRLLIWGTIPGALTFTMNQLVRARGLARESMNGMAISAIVSLAADPFFILYLGMGVRGSAAAALTADLVSIVYFIRLIRQDDILAPGLRSISFSRCAAAGVLSVGFPTFITHFILCGCGILFNRLAMQYGNHVVAAFGVASRALMLPSMISAGLARGAQPLIGYNYASRNLPRMKSVIRISCITGTILCLLLSLFIHLHGGALIHIFTDDPDVVWLSLVILNVMLTAMPVSALEAVLLTTFQAIGNSGVLLVLSVGKQILVYIPLMLLADRYLGLAGLILLDPVKEYLSTLLAFLFYLYVMRSPRHHQDRTHRQDRAHRKCRMHCRRCPR